MDTSNMINNEKYYEDFKEDFEKKYIFEILQDKQYNISIWEGYIDDIFNNPNEKNKEYRVKMSDWSGMTYDWQYDLIEETNKSIDAELYYEDLQNYMTSSFEIVETKEVLILLLDFLKFAMENNYTILVRKE